MLTPNYADYKASSKEQVYPTVLKVRDFKLAFKVFLKSIFYIIVGNFMSLFLLSLLNLQEYSSYLLLAGMVFLFILPVLGFFINFTPVKIKKGYLIVPATDQIRTFTDILTLNPALGYFRKRKYLLSDITRVSNALTSSKNGKQWALLVVGIKNGTAFSQKIELNNNQSRSEAYGILKELGVKVGGDFSY